MDLDPESRLQKLSESWLKFDTIASHLEELQLANEKRNHDERDSFKNRYYKLSEKLKTMIGKLPRFQELTSSGVSSKQTAVNTRREISH